MRAPTQDDRAALKRLARYLVYRPRVVVCFDRQARQDTIDGYSDADCMGGLPSFPQEHELFVHHDRISSAGEQQHDPDRDCD